MNIFLSHAANDAPIADAFCRLLADGLNITRDQVFCSSLPGQNIPGGFNFVDHIGAKLSVAQIVICLFSKNYLDSQFCLAELGACWITGKQLIPIVISPITFSHLKATLSLKQGYEINTEDGLNSIAQDLCKTANLSQWGSAARYFLSGIERLISDQPTPLRVDYRTHKQAMDDVGFLTSKRAELEYELSKRDMLIEELKECKDKTEVQNAMFHFSNEQEQFEHLQEKACSELNELPGIVVEAIYYYLRGLELPVPEAFDDSRWSDVREATDKQFFKYKDESPIVINDEHPKIESAIYAARELQQFMNNASDEFTAYCTGKDEFPFSLSNKEFWEKYLEL